ncbi:acetyl-CoA carboxylase carboxyl transferase subunit alpha, partial [bacterium]|nr:acetyl-CoA carboxylase carboxyl transferase subunit alpha [bacterium]
MEFAQLSFEQPIFDLKKRIEELKKLDAEGDIDFSDEIETLTAKLEKLKEQVYSKLTIWQRVQVARHPRRPYTL